MAPFKSNELKSDWRSDFLIEETDCDCEGCGQDPCIKCGESHHNINEEVQGGVSVETYTKDTRFTEIETVNIIEPEPLVNEGNRTRYRGYSLSGSGNKKDMSKGPNEKVFVDYSKIQAKAPTNQGKKTVDPKKNEVIAASNELEGEQSLVEEVLVEDFMANLYNEGYSVDEINEYLLEEYEIDEEYLEEVWGILAKGALRGAKLLTKGAGYAAKRAVKDSGKVAKFAKNPKNWARANKDLDKVGDVLAKGAKDTKELAARTYAAGQKTRQILDASGKNLLGPSKSFKQLTTSIKKVKQTGDRAIVRQQVKGNLPASNPRIQAAADRYSAKVDLPKIKWNSTVPKSGTGTKLQVEPKVTKVKSLKPASSSPEPKVTKVKVDKRKGRIGDPWNQFPKKVKPQLGLPKKSVDRTNKLLTGTKSPAGALPASKTAGSLPPGKKGGPISKAQSTSVVSSPGGKVVSSPGGKLTKEVKPNERKLSVVDKLNRAKRGSEGKGTTYTSKGVRQLPSGDDPTKVKVAAASLGLGSYAGVKISQKTGLIGKKEKKEVKEGIALAVPAGIGLGKTALKVGGAVLAAKGGEKGMEKLMDIMRRARKDDAIGRELDVKQNQAKDKEKYKDFDTEMNALRRGAKNLSPEDKIQRLRDAKNKRPKDDK